MNRIAQSEKVVTLKRNIRTKLTCDINEESMLIQSRTDGKYTWDEVYYYLNDDIILAIFTPEQVPWTLFPGGLKINAIDLS